MNVWRFLAFGSDEMIMPRTWLLDQDKIRQYEAWTRRQLDQGSIVKNTAATRRAAFWLAIEAKPKPTLKFPRAVNS